MRSFRCARLFFFFFKSRGRERRRVSRGPQGPPISRASKSGKGNPMSKVDQIRIGELCGALQAAGVNTYPWLAGKRREGVSAAPLITVLEKAVVQRPGAADFDAFTEKAFEEICSSE